MFSSFSSLFFLYFFYYFNIFIFRHPPSYNTTPSAQLFSCKYFGSFASLVTAIWEKFEFFSGIFCLDVTPHPLPLTLLMEDLVGHRKVESEVLFKENCLLYATIILCYYKFIIPLLLYRNRYKIHEINYSLSFFNVASWGR